MRIKPETASFLVFSAIFAGLVAFVFWGTWSSALAPVMPDAPIVHSPRQLSEALEGFLREGRFVPGDLSIYLGSPYFWQELKFALALYFAALGMAYFCRGRSLSPIASYGAGLLLAFSGYWCTLYSAGHYGWFQWMTYGVFAFGFVDRALKGNRPRHWLMLGATIAWGSFNQQDLWLLFTVFTAVYFVYRALALKVFPWKGAIMALATFVLIGLPNFRTILFGGVLDGRKAQIERGENITSDSASESEKRWEFVTNWSLPPSETLEAICPRLNGDTSCPFVLALGRKNGVRPYTGALGRPMNAKTGNYRQHSLYLGVVTVVLAFLGVVGAFLPRAKGRADRIFFLVALAVFLSLSYGRYFAAAYRLVFALPFGDLIRCPVKWYHLVEFSAVALAAFGAESLLNLRKPFVPALVGAMILVGACDLARIDHLYCAPVNIEREREMKANMSLTLVSEKELKQPQVAEMVRTGSIVPLSMLSRDVCVVKVLDGWPRRKRESFPLWPFFLLGLPSILATIGVLWYATRRT